MATNAVGGGAVDAEGFLKILLHQYQVGYTRALNVTQRAAGANMSVDVNVDSSSYGGALFATASAVPYFGYTNAVINSTVTTADPTNPRKDIVVAYIDLSLVTTGTTNNLGAFKIKVVPGTAAASPVDPSGATIQASIGAGNPYVSLARVSLTAALGSITNAVITDLRTPAALAMNYLYGGSSNTKGHLVPNQADGTVVTTTDTNSVSAAMLTTNAITLGYAQITAADFTTASTSAVQVTGLTAAVTIPAGGRKIKITAYSGTIYSNASAHVVVTIWDGTVGSGTQLSANDFNNGGTTSITGLGACMAVVTPSAGAKTYNVGFHVSAGTGHFVASATAPAFILVEAI
ncbi:hypothetical protein SAMN04487914_10875 [Arthrobacter sp. ok909]|uniref:hypothetical protein n=1 Tax=Arthrobacter sp. ok909 TaxID=1761746 RepID=UPI0008896584|nr:hypothetical protein [Arthrobacter sp. ok909]SDP32954.1 hypothetical protein SAMN04487914_10875 [Arthrobacter sp. ok909]